MGLTDCSHLISSRIMSLVTVLQDFTTDNLSFVSLAFGVSLGYLFSLGLHGRKEKPKKTEKLSDEPKLLKFQNLDSSTYLVRYLKEFGFFNQDHALDKLKHRTMALPRAQ